MSNDHKHNQTTLVANRSFLVAVALNLLFTVIEAIYAGYANSASLLADAGHNLGDVISLIMAWLAYWLHSRPASPRYTYGYKRTTILVSLFNALILLTSCVFIAYEAIDKLLHPSQIQSKIVLIVALLGIFINGGSALLFQKSQQTDLNMKGAYLHLAYDALISLGVVVGAIITWVTAWLWLDPIIGLLIVVIIIAGTWGLMRDSIQLSLDAVPKSVNHQQVYDYLANLSGVETVHDLHIWSLSTSEIALTVHLVMPTRVLTDAERCQINDHLSQQFKIKHITIQIEQSTNNPCSQSLHC